jgi:hypothetical protein
MSAIPRDTLEKDRNVWRSFGLALTLRPLAIGFAFNPAVSPPPPEKPKKRKVSKKPQAKPAQSPPAAETPIGSAGPGSGRGGFGGGAGKGARLSLGLLATLLLAVCWDLLGLIGLGTLSLAAAEPLTLDPASLKTPGPWAWWSTVRPEKSPMGPYDYLGSRLFKLRLPEGHMARETRILAKIAPLKSKGRRMELSETTYLTELRAIKYNGEHYLPIAPGFRAVVEVYARIVVSDRTIFAQTRVALYPPLGGSETTNGPQTAKGSAIAFPEWPAIKAGRDKAPNWWVRAGVPLPFWLPRLARPSLIYPRPGAD